LPHAREKLAVFNALHIPVIELSAHHADNVNEILLPHLQGKTSLFLGQSGMGKSSILNALIPEAQATINEISSVLDSGKHTTTFTRLYALPNFLGNVIDSPGFQTFGLAHLTDANLVDVFDEFHEPMQACRFYNCTHLHEPGCGVLAALAQGDILPERHALYTALFHEQKTIKY
jgi:ribosome biogenesis GTPase / thiamine phosphate phosphatase